MFIMGRRAPFLKHFRRKTSPLGPYLYWLYQAVPAAAPGKDQSKLWACKSRVRAFTLVEVMIVVSVMGVLAAVAVPGFARARLKAQETHARMMLHQMRSAQMRIYNDTGCYAFPSDMYRATPQLPCYRINLTTGAPLSGMTYPPGSWRGPYLKGPTPREDGIPFYVVSSIPGVIYVFDGHAQAGQRGIYLAPRTTSGFASDGTLYRGW